MNDIRVFPEYSGVDVQLRGAFYEAYKHNPPACSDMLFNTLFGWQRYFDYRVSRQNGFIIVYFIKNGKMSVLPPLSEIHRSEAEWGRQFRELAAHLLAYCRDNSLGLEFTAMPEVYVRRLPDGIFHVSEDRDSYDYVYTRTGLASLEGRAYAQKRNLTRQFEKSYAWQFQKLCAANAESFLDFIAEWDIKSVKNGIIGEGAYCMACRLVDSIGSIDLAGGLLSVGGKTVAAVAASIEDDFLYMNGRYPTAVVHHENALTQYKGVYQMINREFARSLPERIMYVNREEDLGMAGLRKAKLSYNPVLMIKKHRVKLKPEK